jgi:hypothetical protein
VWIAILKNMGKTRAQTACYWRSSELALALQGDCQGGVSAEGRMATTEKRIGAGALAEAAR